MYIKQIEYGGEKHYRLKGFHILIWQLC